MGCVENDVLMLVFFMFLSRLLHAHALYNVLLWCAYHFVDKMSI